MFSYFCCSWIFRIIFISINLLYYTLKVYINNKWGFIRFLILITLSYFSVLIKHIYIKKIFISVCFFMQFKFFSLAKEWSQFRQQKSFWCLDVIPLNNADSFLLQKNVIFVCLESLTHIIPTSSFFINIWDLVSS